MTDLRHARALGVADATITTGLTYCKFPGDDLPAFVERMRELLASAQADIEAYSNGKEPGE